MGPRAVFLSFRFGPTDGVSAVARTWMRMFSGLGFDVSTLTEAELPELGIDATADEDRLRAQVAARLGDADLVVVENLLTIPLNLPASRAVADVLAGRPAIVHHHDPPWHRARFAHVEELPATDPAWVHVAITRILADELAERGIDSTVIHNAFEVPEPRTPEDRERLRDRVRRSVGLGPTERVIAHPVRAIERKNLPTAIELAERIGATYWLLGPAEEGYGSELERLLTRARCPVLHRSWDDAAGIYAAADHVTFPSTWEGFGNPPIEAALHRRTVSVGDYPVARELRGFGFEWFTPDDVDSIAAALDHPGSSQVRDMLDHNQAIAIESFSTRRLRTDLRELLDAAGWMP